VQHGLVQKLVLFAALYTLVVTVTAWPQMPLAQSSGPLQLQPRERQLATDASRAVEAHARVLMSQVDPGGQLPGAQA
jgi:hypothetical protein